MIVDIGKYYSNHFTVAEIASPIFNAMASINSKFCFSVPF